MSIAEKLSDIEVLDLEGKPIKLGTVWQGRTTVLVFIRHYG
ncbi:MAG: hypothetical protein ABI333_02015 [bacterium]